MKYFIMALLLSVNYAYAADSIEKVLEKANLATPYYGDMFYAVSKNCSRFEWSVLDWNEAAIKFYESIGAKPKSEWVCYQLSGEALMKFVES